MSCHQYQAQYQYVAANQHQQPTFEECVAMGARLAGSRGFKPLHLHVVIPEAPCQEPPPSLGRTPQQIRPFSLTTGDAWAQYGTACMS